jgi:two-component system, NtrC family, response regulator AtoC
MGRAGSHTDLPTPMDPQAHRAAADLLLVAGEGQFASHELAGRSVLVIGRGDDCDVRIDHRALSRRHAEFRPGPPPTVRDLGSTNGTLIAGSVRHGGEPIALVPGDAFRIGPFSFVIVGRAATAQSTSLVGRDPLRVLDPTPDGVPESVRDFATSGANVLILGETGVGKEVLASTLHQLSGRTGPLTRINCAALSEALLESELFGHEKGAFTGAASRRIGLLEAAARGTVFLDEIGELPPSIQAKLLRAVEHHEILRLGSTQPVAIDVRFIAATNRDLPAEVAAGKFRADLFFRLDGVTLAIPPLRERRGLIGPLALRFLAGTGKPGDDAPRLGADVLAALDDHDWPGNVRELKAVIERAVVLARGRELKAKHLAFAPRVEAAPEREPDDNDTPPPEELDAEQRADRERVLRALDECAGNQTRAAKRLGMSRTAFVTKLRIYRIPRPRT